VSAVTQKQRKTISLSKILKESNTPNVWIVTKIIIKANLEQIAQNAIQIRVGNLSKQVADLITAKQTFRCWENTLLFRAINVTRTVISRKN